MLWEFATSFFFFWQPSLLVSWKSVKLDKAFAVFPQNKRNTAAVSIRIHLLIVQSFSRNWSYYCGQPFSRTPNNGGMLTRNWNQIWFSEDILEKPLWIGFQAFFVYHMIIRLSHGVLVIRRCFVYDSFFLSLHVVWVITRCSTYYGILWFIYHTPF